MAQQYQGLQSTDDEDSAGERFASERSSSRRLSSKGPSALLFCTVASILGLLSIYFFALADQWPLYFRRGDDASIFLDEFPGMDDNTTCMEGCSARIIAQLYRSWTSNNSSSSSDHHMMTLPYTPILYQRNYNNESVLPPPSSFLESTEIVYPSHSCPWDVEDTKCQPVADFMLHTCATSDTPGDPDFMIGFTIYTDGAKVMRTLAWDYRPCTEVLDSIDGHGETLQLDIPLPMGGNDKSSSRNKKMFHGDLIVFRERYETRYSPVGPMIYIRDPASNSCWIVDCGVWKETDEKDHTPCCVEDAQLGLVELSVSDFVNNLKGVWCE